MEGFIPIKLIFVG